MKKSLFVVVAITSTLAGCASTNTGIVQIADDTYMYAKQDWMAYSGSVVKAELYKEANAFCAGKGKKFAPLNSTNEDYKPYQSSAAAEIQFTCK
ncbi:MAG: hypothetical protein ACD_23C00699G0003 [uncultured bacterium]|nr:MAG: hypothetical protein ACD_23C00699G0003 [uncultured bacterium]